MEEAEDPCAREVARLMPGARDEGVRVGLFDRLRNRALPRRWEQSPGGAIWRLQPTVGGVLIGEARAVQERRLSLFAIRPDSGDLLWSGLEFDEPWWIALETTIGDVALLHRYPRPDRPETCGCIAVDALDGHILWEDRTGRAIFGDGSTLLLQRGEPTDWSDAAIVDVRTGEPLRTIQDRLDDVLDYQEACGDQKRWQGWVGMEEIPGGAEGWEELLGRLGVPRSATIVGSLERATYGPWSAIVVHTTAERGASGITSMLYLLRDDKVFLRQELHAGSPGPSGDSFFIWNGVLMAVRNGTSLLGIDLRN